MSIEARVAPLEKMVMALMAHLLALDGDNHLDRQAQRQLEVSAKVWGETYPRGRYPAAFGKTELSGSAP